MNDLEQFFSHGKHRLIHKWKHYFEIYDRHLHHLRDKKINFLEIGIAHGGSIQMWDHYFKGNAQLYAIDINPECKKFESKNVKIFIGSQEDENFLREVKRNIPKVDVLIDDGGHTMKQQIVTFENLFDHVTKNGIYICEDLHTSYMELYGGGLQNKASFIEYSKHFIDKLHAWYSEEMQVDEFVKSTHSLHFYDSMFVVEKRPMEKPYDVKAGDASIEDVHAAELIVKKKWYRLR